MSQDQPLLTIKGLVKRFGGFKLGPIDLMVPRGSLFGLIGPNGAGKTTLLKALMNMGGVDEGSAELCGLHFHRDEPMFKAKIGFSSPIMNWGEWGRIEYLLSFIGSFYPDWDHAYAVELLQRFTLNPTEKIKTLSTGAQTKLGLLIAMAHRPELLLLDEPTVGLDAVSRRILFDELLGVIESGSRSAVISSHDLTDLERYTDHIAIIHQGEVLIEGPTDDTCARFALLRIDANDQRQTLPGMQIIRRQAGKIDLLIDKHVISDSKIDELASLGAVAINLEDLFLAMTTGENNAIRDI